VLHTVGQFKCSLLCQILAPTLSHFWVFAFFTLPIPGHHEQTLHHSQSRKYIAYCNATTDRSRSMKHLVMIGRSLEDVLVDGETHRHRHRYIHHNTLLHYWRGETHNCLTAHYRPVTQETITHSHQSWSSHILYQLPPSTTIHSILLVQFTCLTVLSTTSLQVLYSIIGRGGRSNKVLSVEDDRTDSPVTTHFRWAFSASTAFVIRVLGLRTVCPSSSTTLNQSTFCSGLLPCSNTST